MFHHREVNTDSKYGVSCTETRLFIAFEKRRVYNCFALVWVEKYSMVYILWLFFKPLSVQLTLYLATGVSPDLSSFYFQIE